jgi:nucleotide-binding universal stress UspA family protein
MIDSSAGNNAIDAKSLSEHLAHHGVEVGTSILRIGADQEHDALRREIDQQQYDLLVMGGYSHAMWFEFMFGGVTQSLLLSSKIPILVSH